MSGEIKERCIYCGGDVLYHSGESLIKCGWCGQTLVVAKFENELTRLKESEAEHAQVREKLKKAEKDKQAADNRLFAALSDLDSLGSAQGEIRDLLEALQADTASSSHVLGDMLRALISGQNDAEQKLQMLSYFSERLLKSQDDVLMKVQTQSEMIGQLYSLEMDAKERQTLATEFMLWMQSSHAEDVQKLQQINESSYVLLKEQRKISEHVEMLRQDASDIQQRLKNFEDKWEKARLQELHHLYHQAADFQQDKRYDKAEDYYRKVLTKGGGDSEVYWRLLMCHYGLTYQKDDEGNLIPIILNPDLTDPDEMSLRKELDRNLSQKERPVYEAELSKIDCILDKYRLLKDQVRYDVFISVKQEIDDHYTVDSDIASDLYDFLSGQGLRVFNSRRTNIPAGQEYEPYIISALMSAKVLIVVGTTPDNMNAQWVKNEWSRFQWLQRREREKAGKTERVLICYLAKGMQAKQIPKALNPNRQAIYDGVKAHDDLLSGLSFLLKGKTSKAEEKKYSNESMQSAYYRVINQMTTWLFMGKYTKVLEKYEELTENGLYLTKAQVHLSALCAEKHVPDIQKIVCSELILDQMPLYNLAVKLCQKDEEKEELRDLLTQNREWRSGLQTAEEEKKEEVRKASAENDGKPKTSQELYELGVSCFLGQGVPKDKIQAVRYFKEAAALGHAGASNWLKDIQKESDEKTAEDWYQKGLLCARSAKYTEAADWYRKAAGTGHADAQNRLGVLLETGNGIAVNYEEAASWYKKAAVQGNSYAQYNYARCLMNGRGTDKNEIEAVNWFRLAAERGDADAQNWMGYCYENGIGIGADADEAGKWYQMASARGHEKAKENLDRIIAEKNKQSAKDWYQRGKTAEGNKNYTEALMWYRKAAEAGNASAQTDLGFYYEKGRGVPANMTEAVRWYKMASENGDDQGQHNYAWCLLHGSGVAKNESEAVRWFRKAAEGGHASAQTWLGFCYEMGTGVPVNKEEAVRWYRKAAENGNLSGQYDYGLCLKDGKGVPKDEAEAVRWFRKAAEGGYANAQTWLGVCYETGTGVAADKQEAARWYKKAAENGDLWGQYDYGLCLINGRGVPKNEAEAVRWFRKAAESGHAKAQTWLGVCYEQGTGVAADKQEAARWYKKAAENGESSGQYDYGLCLKNGTGVTKNEAEAVKWFRKAAEGGHASAQTWLGVCYEMGTGVAADKQEAARWYKKAAENGDLWGQYDYGLCLKNGTGIPKNEAEAVKWFRKAAEGGNSSAQYWLGYCYETGLGVSKNKEEAKVWYQKAANQGHEESKKNLEKLNKKKWF